MWPSLGVGDVAGLVAGPAGSCLDPRPRPAIAYPPHPRRSPTPPGRREPRRVRGTEQPQHPGAATRQGFAADASPSAYQPGETADRPTPPTRPPPRWPIPRPPRSRGGGTRHPQRADPPAAPATDPPRMWPVHRRATPQRADRPGRPRTRRHHWPRRRARLPLQRFGDRAGHVDATATPPPDSDNGFTRASIWSVSRTRSSTLTRGNPTAEHACPGNLPVNRPHHTAEKRDGSQPASVISTSAASHSSAGRDAGHRTLATPPAPRKVPGQPVGLPAGSPAPATAAHHRRTPHGLPSTPTAAQQPCPTPRSYRSATPPAPTPHDHSQAPTPSPALRRDRRTQPPTAT